MRMRTDIRRFACARWIDMPTTSIQLIQICGDHMMGRTLQTIEAKCLNLLFHNEQHKANNRCNTICPPQGNPIQEEDVRATEMESK